jgi:alkanesulfonate monooxygenase
VKLLRPRTSGSARYYGKGLCVITVRFGPRLLGSFDDVAGALLEYKEIGVTQFIMSGWPELDEVRTFGNEVVTRVRRAEA